MLKGFSRLWWRGAQDIGRLQQRQYKKLVKILQKQPIARTKSVRAKSVALEPNIVTVGTKRSQSIGNLGTQLPGKWIASYITSFERDGRLAKRRMNYWIYLPRCAASSPLAMVVMLHGCEQTVSQFSQGTRMNKLAEEKGFAVLYPQQSLRGNPSRCWLWYDRATQQGGGDVRLIAQVIDAAIAKYSIDANRLYISGMSAGAAMSHILALTLPGRFSALGLHSGPVFGGAQTAMGAFAVMQGGSVKAVANAIAGTHSGNASVQKIPAILIHGDLDATVRPVNQTQLAQQFKIVNHLSEKDAISKIIKGASRPKSNIVRHSYGLQDYVVENEVILRVCKVSGLGHAWSGGDCDLQFNDCAGPDASKMMWEFFKDKCRRNY